MSVVVGLVMWERRHAVRASHPGRTLCGIRTGLADVADVPGLRDFGGTGEAGFAACARCLPMWRRVVALKDIGSSPEIAGDTRTYRDGMHIMGAFRAADYTEAEAGRFCAKLRPSPTASGCWLWRGATNSKGYGCLGLRKRPWLAHRLAYTVLVGPIPDGLVVDHVKARGCRHKTCVNPAHLEAVTNDVNLGRGYVAWEAAMRPIRERQRREAAARQAARRAMVERALHGDAVAS